MKLKIKRLTPTAKLPQYQSAGASGMDLCADINDTWIVWYGSTPTLVPTGISIELPPGYEAQVRPRSGLAIKYGITVINTPGTIDQDYRGEIKVALISMTDEIYAINPGDRIAQLVIAPVVRVEVEETTELSSTDRGDGGFGSTGV